MEPRNPNSKKWTAFPGEFVDQIKGVFAEAFKPSLSNAKLVAEGRIYSHEILLRVGFRENNELRQNNFEASMDFDPAKENALEQIYRLIDVLALTLNEYFEGKPASAFPTFLKEIKFEGRAVHFQFSTVNTDLEAAADEILGSTTGLYNETLPELEPLKNEPTLH